MTKFSVSTSSNPVEVVDLLDTIINGSFGDKKELLNDIANNGKNFKYFCNDPVGHGASGVVFINSIPRSIRVLVKDVKEPIKLQTVTKTIREEYELNADITEEKIDGKDYLIFTSQSGNFRSGSIISNVVSNIFTEGVSPHITICAGFSICNNVVIEIYEDLSHRHNNEIISNLKSFDKLVTSMQLRMTDKLINYIIFGFLHTLYTLSYNFVLIHNDIHIPNLLFKVFDEEPYFHGKNMKKVKYFEYHIPNRTFYLKNYGFIPKIIDYGFSIMNINNVIVRSRNNKYDNKLIRYPMTKKLVPEYISLIRKVSGIIGSTDLSHALEKLYPRISVNSIRDGNFNPKDYPSVYDILMNDAFDHMTTKPKDFTKENSISITYKLDKVSKKN